MDKIHEIRVEEVHNRKEGKLIKASESLSVFVSVCTHCAVFINQYCIIILRQHPLKK